MHVKILSVTIEGKVVFGLVPTAVLLGEVPDIALNFLREFRSLQLKILFLLHLLLLVFLPKARYKGFNVTLSFLLQQRRGLYMQ